MIAGPDDTPSTPYRPFPPPPMDTPAEMGRPVRELRSAEFAASHPALQAAYAHYAFVAIHPFADGNGRVARVLASAYLYRRPGVPLVIFADQKDEYIDALEAADTGNPQPFVRFIEGRVADIVGVVEVATARPDTPPASTSLAAPRELYRTGEPGLSADDRTAVAQRVLLVAVDEIREQLSALDLPAAVRVRDSPWFHTSEFRKTLARLSAEYDLIEHEGPGVRLQGTSDIEARVGLAAAALRIGTNDPPLRLVTTTGQSLGIHARDIHPVLTSVFTAKLKTWVESLVIDLLARFERASRDAVQPRPE
jgi:hypothetical protein